MRYAYVVDRTVRELLDADTDLDAYHPTYRADVHEAGDEVQEGWTFAHGVFSPPPLPAPPSEVELKATLSAYVADRRWQLEQAGTVWSGWPIHTDDRSQGKYLSELQAIALDARVDGDPWKFADGVFRPVSNADFSQLTIAAREHVRTVFGIEAGVLAEIAAGTITTVAEIDAAFA